MKNRELIAILSGLPLDAEVLVHGEAEGEEYMWSPREAHAEFTCNEDEQVIRLNLDTPLGMDDV